MREKIIDTAIEEFTKNGLKFTMNDVAKALGISKKPSIPCSRASRKFWWRSRIDMPGTLPR